MCTIGVNDITTTSLLVTSVAAADSKVWSASRRRPVRAARVVLSAAHAKAPVWSSAAAT